MKRSIFMYLFLFAVLWIIFQFVNVKKVSDDYERRINNTENQLQKARDSVVSLDSRLFELDYFSLRGNDKAYDYFERDNYDIDSLTLKVSDGVIEKNTAKGNVLVDWEGDGSPFLINKVHLLNHRWIIADFSDGSRWGELLIQYFINEDGSIDYEVVESLIYPN